MILHMTQHVLLLRIMPGFAAFSVAVAVLGWWITPSDTQITASQLRMIAGDSSNQSRLAKLIRSESDSTSKREIAVSAMPCFWSGEGFYGAIPGVYRTTPGMIGGDEVVEVEFDPTIISYQSLMSRAHHAGKATRIYCRDDKQFEIAKSISLDAAIRSDEPLRLDDQPKWYILQTPLKSIPMTPAQSCRINSALHAREEIDSLLSPAQMEMYEKARNNQPISETDREALKNQLAQDLKNQK